MSIAEALRKIDVLKSCKLPDTIGRKARQIEASGLCFQREPARSVPHRENNKRQPVPYAPRNASA